MFQDNKNQFLEKLRELGILQDNTQYLFDPKNTSFFKLTWRSPNDKLDNIINFYIDENDNNFMRLKDRH